MSIEPKVNVSAKIKNSKNIIFIVIGIGLIFLLPRIQGEIEIKKLEQLMMGANINTLKINDRVYSLQNGAVQPDADFNTKRKILRLAAFYQWNKEDPLFDSPDLDINASSSSVDNLSKTQDQLLQAMQDREEIYPIEFLKSSIKTAKLRREFLDNPSYDRAQQLIAAERDLIYSYKNNATTLRAVVVPVSTPALSLTPYVSISKKVVLQDLSTILDNGVALDNEIKKRDDCLNGKGECARPSSYFPKPNQEIVDNPDTPAFIDPSLVYNYTKQEDGSKVSGPYAALTKCLGFSDNFTPEKQYFYISTSPNNSIKVNSATEIYFLRFNSKLPADAKMIDMGITRYIESPLVPYFCPDRGYEAEVLETNLFVHTQKPLFPLKIAGLSSEEEAFFKEAEKAEREFFSEKYPFYQDLSLLADYYGYSYKLLSSKQLNSVELNTKDELLNRYLEIKRKLGDRALTIDNIVLLSKSERDLVNVYRNPSYTQVYKNYYGSLYLPFSQSFWRLPDDPQYIENIKVLGAIGPDSNYITYHQALTLYPQETINKWFGARKILNQILKSYSVNE